MRVETEGRERGREEGGHGRDTWSLVARGPKSGPWPPRGSWPVTRGKKEQQQQQQQGQEQQQQRGREEGLPRRRGSVLDPRLESTRSVDLRSKSQGPKTAGSPSLGSRTESRRRWGPSSPPSPLPPSSLEESRSEDLGVVTPRGSVLGPRLESPRSVDLRSESLGPKTSAFPSLGSRTEPRRRWGPSSLPPRSLLHPSLPLCGSVANDARDQARGSLGKNARDAARGSSYSRERPSTHLGGSRYPRDGSLDASRWLRRAVLAQALARG